MSDITKDYPKSVSILGSTGTIGKNTLKCIENNPDKFFVKILAANENVEILAEQAKKFRPELVAVANKSLYGKLKELLSGSDINIVAGEEELTQAAESGADITMSAIVGSAGLKPTMAAIKNGKKVAIANKESLVCAGELVKRAVKKYKTTLIPVDSEHNAVFQIFNLMNEKPEKYIEKVTLTASGGPFREFTLKQMENVTPEQAVKHPNWNMGAKISVDSASLMNKGLEIIEAFYLFPLEINQLDVVIHPQSIIHALVEIIDGSVLAQMSMPDMCTPIACALAWPSRIPAPVQKLDLANIGNLQFEKPDYERFPALRLAYEALKNGGNAPTILNAANEIAVQRFLKEDIKFLDITRIVEKTLQKMYNEPPANIEEVLEYDKSARDYARELR